MQSTTVFQPTASRARSLLFGGRSVQRSRQLNANPLGRTQPQVCSKTVRYCVPSCPFQESRYHAHIALTGKFISTKEMLMPYVHDLRALVGHRPLILVAAGVLICNAAGDLLLQ